MTRHRSVCMPDTTHLFNTNYIMLNINSMDYLVLFKAFIHIALKSVEGEQMKDNVGMRLKVVTGHNDQASCIVQLFPSPIGHTNHCNVS